MTVIPVGVAKNAYDILVEPGALQNIAQHLAPYANNGRLFIVTDTNVARHWSATVTENLKAANISCSCFTLPAGEKSKSWKMLEELTDYLLQEGVERKDHLVALGGGVVGDITGFAASLVKRGCGFVQVPTTLLAQVDSSVGGKTAINSRAGKNLIGAFHQPSFVLIDPEILTTLPERELRAGYAEVVKYGLIDDAEFFAWCEANGAALLAGDIDLRAEAIIRSVSAKAKIVAADEKELSGVRALLNLGHTFGHALEAETGFSDTLVHGEGVAAGMALAFRYSERLGLSNAADTRHVVTHLKNAGLPHSLTTAHVSADGATLVGHMLHDKKMSGGNLPFLLTRGIGKTFLADNVDLDDVAAFLDASD